MTPKQTFKLAKEAGLSMSLFKHGTQMGDELERFAELWRNEVLEEAAKQRVTQPKKPQGYYMSMSPIQVAKEDGFDAGFKAGTKALRDAIRGLKS